MTARKPATDTETLPAYLSDADLALLTAIQVARGQLDSDAAALNARGQALAYAADRLADHLTATYQLAPGDSIVNGRIVRAEPGA